MSFKDSLDIEAISSISSNIAEKIESIKEFGHVSIHPSAEDKLKSDKEKIIKLLTEVDDILDGLTEEMQDWYSY